MKILIIPSSLLPMPPVKGGAVQNLIQQLIDYNECICKHDITCVSISNLYAEKKVCESKLVRTEYKFVHIPLFLQTIRDKQIKFFSRKIYQLIDYLYMKSVNMLINSENFDCVIFENTVSYLRFYKPKSNVKTLLHLHNDYLSSSNKNIENLNKVDKVVCISRFIEGVVLRSNNNIETSVVYNGILSERFLFNEQKRIDFRTKYSIPDNYKVILFSGRYVKEKGVLELVKAYNKANCLNTVLVLAGSMVYGDTVKDQYYNLVQKEVEKASGRIIQLGYVAYDDMPMIISGSDIGALTPLWEEPLSLSVIEYMTAGLPIIISKVGGMQELYTHNCGCIVERGNDFVDNISAAIQKLSYNNEFYNLCKLTVLSESKKYTTDIYSENFFKTIE